MVSDETVRIRALCDEAVVAGDYLQAHLADRAIQGKDKAQQTVWVKWLTDSQRRWADSLTDEECFARCIEAIESAWIEANSER